MAEQRLGKYQMREFKTWGGMSKSDIVERYLGTELRKDPQMAETNMIQLMAANNGAYMLEHFLTQWGTKKFEDDSFFFWNIIGDSEKNIPLVEARDEDGNVITSSMDKMVGAGTMPFQLVFGTKYFFEGEVIVGNMNEVYPMKIIGEGREEGSNWVYTVELMAGNVDGIPSDRLLAGEKFSYEYAPTSKSFDRKKGGLRYGTSVSMRNGFSMIRLYDKQDSYAGDKKFMVKYPCITGYKDGHAITEWQTRWIDVVKFTFEKTWSEYKNKLLAFSRNNENSNGEYTNFDSNGEVLRMGSGLFEQLDAAGVIPYNTFSLEQLTQHILQLVTNKTEYRNRTYVMRTGTGGFMQFSQAVANMASSTNGWTMTSQNPATVQKAASEYHSNSLAFGYQFVEYRGPMGIVLKCEIDPMYDEKVRNKIIWKAGLPAKSYRYDIFDIGNKDIQNIFKAEVKNMPERRGYVTGPFYNAYTFEQNIRYAATDEDSSSQHIKATLGVGVLDATRTLAYVPSVLIA